MLTVVVSAAAAQPRVLDRDLAAAMKEAHLPSLAAVVCRQDAIVGIGAVGVRRIGSSDAVTISDRFHIGSNAKAMLATVIAMLVEEGKLSWESKAAEVLGIVEGNRTESREITLTQLLNDHAGLPPFEDDNAPEWKAWARERPSSGRADERVQQFSEWLLLRPPANRPGSTFVYSNAGYVVAAAMAERTTGMSWQQLLRERLFQPLGMSAGFGWPAANGGKQPFGHYDAGKSWKIQDRNDPIPPFIGPAGNVNASLQDYARFVQLHLRGLNGRPELVHADSFRRMHTPTDGYGFGWKITQVDGVPASFHTGSAGTFYAIATIIASRDIAVAVFTNSGGERAQSAAVALTKQLLQTFRDY